MTTQARAVTAVESLPLWIGPPDRPLFAWLDVPDDGLAVGVAVICPSMGLEAAYSSRALRALAHQLAGNRWAALRFDYAATGDSVGSWTDPGLVAEWLGNVRLAIDTARTLGAARVGVVGLRLGATLAAAELAGGEPVDDLVLWDPCATGRGFLREQIAFAAFRRRLAVEWGVESKATLREPRPEPEDGLVEAPGAVFSGATAADLGPLAVAWSDHSPASRELVLTREGRRIERAVAKRLTHARRGVLRDGRAGGALRGAAHDTGADAGPDRLLAGGAGRIAGAAQHARKPRVGGASRTWSARGPRAPGRARPGPAVRRAQRTRERHRPVGPDCASSSMWG